MTAKPPTNPTPLVAPRLIEPDQNDNEQANPLFRDVSLIILKANNF